MQDINVMLKDDLTLKVNETWFYIPIDYSTLIGGL